MGQVHGLGVRDQGCLLPPVQRFLLPGSVLSQERKRLLYRQPTGPNPLHHRDDFSRPALRHGSLNIPFRVDFYLPGRASRGLSSSASPASPASGVGIESTFSKNRQRCTAERGGNNLKLFPGICLKTKSRDKTRICPLMSYVYQYGESQRPPHFFAPQGPLCSPRSGTL